MSLEEAKTINDENAMGDAFTEEINNLWKQTFTNVEKSEEVKITREELLKEIEYEEYIREDEELVNFIPVDLLNVYWRYFGGLFFQRKGNMEHTMQIIYRNAHSSYMDVMTDITDLSIYQITRIIKTGLSLGIDLFTSVNKKAMPIQWRAEIERREK